jgi:hypothetical protein
MQDMGSNKDYGFIREIDSSGAHRQLVISTSLLGVLAAATLMAVLTLRIPAASELGLHRVNDAQVGYLMPAQKAAKGQTAGG